MDNKIWIDNNKSYWDGLANKYNLLYNDKWSILENNYIAFKLNEVLINEKCKVLDLGCGTGLGFDLSSQSGLVVDYVGVDLSNQMITELKRNHNSVTAVESSMSNLDFCQPNSFDNVISLFTSFSYTDDLNKTVSEIHRVLKPNGKILISVISKYSLRRLINLKFGNKEEYKTRGTISKEFSEAWVFSRNSLKNLFAESDFKDIKVEGYNPFAGISLLTNHPKSWKFNLSLAKALPFLSHELLITATKK